MSAAAQLDLDGVFGGLPIKAKKPSAAQTLCKCGHDVREHANGKASCSSGAHFGSPCDCKRFRGRGRKPVPVAPNLEAPVGAIELKRPDTKRAKAMGWALFGASTLTVYLEQLKTKSLNDNRFMRGRYSPAMQRRLIAAEANYRKALCERAMSALEQCDPLRNLSELARPSKVTITRVSTGKLDDDNLAGALKHVRDGVAEALLFDDREFSIAGERAGCVPLFYRQEAPGKRGVFGVRIEITWKEPNE